MRESERDKERQKERQREKEREWHIYDKRLRQRHRYIDSFIHSSSNYTSFLLIRSYEEDYDGYLKQ